MRKIIYSLIAVATAFAAAAQTNPLEVVPNRKGEHIDTKCYDAAGNLRATMRYEIADYTPNAVEDDLKIVFTMTDSSGRVIDYGTIEFSANRGATSPASAPISAANSDSHPPTTCERRS